MAVTIRRKVGFTRFDRWVFALGVIGAGLAAGVLWISQQMIAPPRPRVSESSRPVLGVTIRADGDALRVVRVADPARAAGFRPEDRITRIDGEPPGGPDDFARRIREAAPGHAFTLEARRPRPEGGGDDAVVATVTPEVRRTSPADEGLPYEEVAFPNGDGLTLRGWFIPAPGGARSGAVVYGHGNAADRRQWLAATPAVHQAGIAQLLIDFAGRGESDGEVITLGAHEANDLAAGLAWLRARDGIDRTRCALAGKSMGGAAALLAAAEEGSRVRAVVADSSFADLARLVDETIASCWLPPKIVRPLAFGLAGWRADFDPAAVRPVDAIARIRAPILLLHGDRDEIIAIDHARALERAADGRAKLVVLEGLGHNTPREDATYEAVARFLADAFASRP